MFVAFHVVGFIAACLAIGVCALIMFGGNE